MTVEFDRERLAKLIGRLGSEHAGERENAFAAIKKLLAASGLTWSWVCELVAGGELVEVIDGRDRLLTRLVGDRVKEAMVGGWCLLREEYADLRAVNAELVEVRSLQRLSADEIRRAIEVSDLVRQRVGRRW